MLSKEFEGEDDLNVMKYKDVHKKFVKEHEKLSLKDLTNAFNNHFGLNQSQDAIRGLKQRSGAKKYEVADFAPIKRMVGNKYGYLEVIGVGEPYFDKNKKKTNRALCRCVCGKEVSCFVQALKMGRAKSCGCKQFTALKKHNAFQINGGEVCVKLTNCTDTMLCDIDVWSRLKKYCWIKGKTGYAEANINGYTTLFHHLVIDCPDDMVRDHINQNKLDNRRSNLRVVTRLVNNNNVDRKCTNPLGYTGLYKNGDKIAARVSMNGKVKYIGSFESIEEAVNARNKALKEYHSRLGVI